MFSVERIWDQKVIWTWRKIQIGKLITNVDDDSSSLSLELFTLGKFELGKLQGFTFRFQDDNVGSFESSYFQIGLSCRPQFFRTI